MASNPNKNQDCDELFRAAKHKELIQRCMQRGGDPCARDEWGHTLLHEAVRNGESYLVDYLLNNTSVDVNAKSHDHGNTPLHLATRYRRMDLLKKLLANGANINAVDRNGCTCLHAAVNGDDIRVIQFLIRAGADLDVINDFSETPLSIAIGKRSVAAIELLLRCGADLNIKRPMSIPLFHEAVLQFRLPDLKILRLLHRFGAECHDLDENRRTAMHYAALVGYVQVAKFLVQIGCDINATDVSGKTPLDVATNHQNLLMMDYLMDLKAKHGAALASEH